MARKDDRRIQRTRKQLRESMLALILDRGYDDFSIQDITDHANLGRATFYLHYREKDELYRDVLANMADEFVKTLPKKDSKDRQTVSIRNLERLFEFLENKYDLYRIITVGRSMILTSAILTEIFREHIKIFRLNDADTHDNVTDIPLDFLVSYNASTLKSTVFWWLENEMPYPPAEMARIYEKVSFYTNYQILRSGTTFGTNLANGLNNTIKQEDQSQTETSPEVKDEMPKKDDNKKAKKENVKQPTEQAQEEPASEDDLSELDKEKIK